MPAARYQVRVYDPYTGTLQATIVNWRSLFLERKLNSFDEMQLSLEVHDPNIQYFKLDSILEVWRLVDKPGAVYYRESTLFHRTTQREFTPEQHETFVSFSRGLNDLLRRRNIQYYSTTAFTLKQGPADNIMKEFVIENAAAGANNPERKSYNQWNAAFLGLRVEANKSQGPKWQGAHAWDNLLEVLLDIASTSKVDFDIVRIAPLEFEFRTYYPQLGTDRSNYVLFSPQLGNMVDISYSLSRSEEVTAVIVGGQGDGVDRRVYPLIRTSAASASPWNIIETNEDGRSQPTLNDLKHIAEQSLEEKSASETFTFNVLQTDSRKYGSEYFLGDIVKAKYRDIESIKKINKVSLRIAEGREEVKIEFDEKLNV